MWYNGQHLIQQREVSYGVLSSSALLNCVGAPYCSRLQKERGHSTCDAGV
jgi:hypothetical protein